MIKTGKKASVLGCLQERHSCDWSATHQLGDTCWGSKQMEGDMQPGFSSWGVKTDAKSAKRKAAPV